MKLACPKCGRHLAVADNLVPGAGGWARCPRCGEKFFLKPPAGPELGSPNVSSAPVRGGADREELLKRLKVRSPQAAAAAQQWEDNHADFEEVTIFPRRALSPETALAAGCLILTLALLSTLLLFLSSVHHREEFPQDRAPARLNNDQSPDLVRQDLVDILRRHSRRDYLWVVVDFTGPESRVFKYCRDRLVPEDHCPNLVRLELKSTAPAEGLSLFGSCQDHDGRQDPEPLELRLKWVERAALAGFTGYQGFLELEMFP
jgi:predicted Zn finger-like uncharacterized protein